MTARHLTSVFKNLLCNTVQTFCCPSHRTISENNKIWQLKCGIWRRMCWVVEEQRSKAVRWHMWNIYFNVTIHVSITVQSNILFSDTLIILYLDSQCISKRQGWASLYSCRIWTQMRIGKGAGALKTIKTGYRNAFENKGSSSSQLYTLYPWILTDPWGVRELMYCVS